MKTTKWFIAALAAGALALLAAGCDDGMTDAALNAMLNNAMQNNAAQNVAVEGIIVMPDEITLESGTTFTLTAEITPKNASDKTVEWSSSNDDVATVDEDGTVTAKQVSWTRTVRITATTRDGGKAATCRVTVKEKVIAVEEILLSETALTLMPGGTARLTAEVKPDDADNRTVRWSSSDSDVARVDYYDGTVTAYTKGTATIYAMAGGMRAECAVTVSVPDGFEIDRYGRLTKYTGNDATVVIPDGVKGIGYSAFSGCTGLTEVKIPDSVTSIGSSAFSGCTGLTEVKIPDSVTSIGDGTFSGCTNLTDVTIPDSVTSIGEYAFSGCTGLKTVEIGEGVTSIGDGTFSGCTNLTDVTIPNGVTSIGSYAFYGCTGLTEVTIPDGVTEIKHYAFYGCTSLEKVSYTGTLAQWCGISWVDSSANPLSNGNAMLYIDGSAVTDVVIPGDVTEIKACAFCGYKNLTSVTISDGVTSIEVGTPGA